MGLVKDKDDLESRVRSNLNNQIGVDDLRSAKSSVARQRKISTSPCIERLVILP